jgi:flagellar hook protein FlgE
MTIYGAFGAGIAGLQAQSNKLGIISDNIANQNTVGYKAAQADFHTLVTLFGTSNAYSPGGVTAGGRNTIHQQGGIQQTDTPTYVAISGGGFFTVSNASNGTGSLLYTRSGAFSVDTSGYFVNSSGYYLQGWALDDSTLDATLSADTIEASAAEAALTTVQIAQTTGEFTPTSAITVRARLDSSETATANTSIAVRSNLNAAQVALPTTSIDVLSNLNASEVAFSPATDYDPLVSGMNMASGGVTPHFNRSISVIDGTGAERTLSVSFLKTADASWAVELYSVPPTAVTTTDGQIGYGSITFNPDGSLATVSTALQSALTADWDNVGGATDILLNFGTIGLADGIKQIDEPYAGLMFANPDYDPTSATGSMASGDVTPSYTRTLSVLDSAGTTRTLTASFLKTGNNQWAVEVYAPNATDVTTPAGTVAGQLLYGNITFNDDGNPASFSSSLTTPVTISWSDMDIPTTTLFDFGALSSATGLTQNASAYANTATTPALLYSPLDATANMASASITPHFSRALDVIDQSGTTHSFNVAFLKTAQNSWAIELYAQTAADVTSADGLVADGTATFNGDGTLAAVSDSLLTFDIPWTTGDPSTITVNWGTAGEVFGTTGATVIGRNDGLSQVNTGYEVDFIRQNGSAAGELADVSIDADGYVIAAYDNNTVQRLYKIPLAIFYEQNELRSLTNNVFERTAEAGVPLYAQAGRGAAGVIQPESLESSNVEIGSQLVDMIVAQRAYQSNTKIVSTTDDMLKTITELLR